MDKNDLIEWYAKKYDDKETEKRWEKLSKKKIIEELLQQYDERKKQREQQVILERSTFKKEDWSEEMKLPRNEFEEKLVEMNKNDLIAWYAKMYDDKETENRWEKLSKKKIIEELLQQYDERKSKLCQP